MNSSLQVLAIVILSFVSSYATEVRKCSGDDTPFMDDLKVQLGNCTTGRCKLAPREEYNFKQTFTAIADCNQVSSTATTVFMGDKLRFYVFDDPDMCENTSNENDKIGCPLKKGEKYVHERKFTTGKDEPKISVDIQWHIMADGKNITCFEIPIEFV